MKEWLLSENLAGRITSPGFLEAWRDPSKQVIFAAWNATTWFGNIKISNDMVKQTKGSKMLVQEGWSTNAREARVTTGSKFSRNIKRLIEENKQKAEAMRPLLEIQKEFGISEEVDNSDVVEQTNLGD